MEPGYRDHHPLPRDDLLGTAGGGRIGLPQLETGQNPGETRMKTQDVLPVVMSILVIITIAVVEKQSKTLAAITAVMPVTAPLALWIVYSSSGGEQTAMNEFTSGLIMGLIPTFGFVIAAWLAARAGLKIGPIILTGYSAWAVITGIIFMLRKLLGAR
jgi:hypothetical protein